MRKSINQCSVFVCNPVQGDVVSPDCFFENEFDNKRMTVCGGFVEPVKRTEEFGKLSIIVELVVAELDDEIGITYFLFVQRNPTSVEINLPQRIGDEFCIGILYEIAPVASGVVLVLL